METAKRFLDEAMKNETLSQKLREASTKENLLNIARAHGYDLSDGDLLALGNLVMTRARERANEVLTDEELLRVTGGFGLDFIGDIFQVLLSSSDARRNRP